MRGIKIGLGIYQVLLTAFWLFWLVMAGKSLTSGSGMVHMFPLFMVLLLVLPTITFCAANAIKLFSNGRLLGKWTSIGAVSYVFTILATVLVFYLVVFGTTWGSKNRCESESVNSVLQAGIEAPNFSGTDQYGASISLEQFRGRYVLLDFWATWCGPCMQEMPDVDKVWEEWGDKLVVIGINKDRSKGDLEKYLKMKNASYSQLFDKGGEISKSYGIRGIPHIILIDKEGKIIKAGLRGARIRKAVVKAMQGND